MYGVEWFLDHIWSDGWYGFHQAVWIDDLWVMIVSRTVLVSIEQYKIVGVDRVLYYTWIILFCCIWIKFSVFIPLDKAPYHQHPYQCPFLWFRSLVTWLDSVYLVIYKLSISKCLLVDYIPSTIVCLTSIILQFAWMEHCLPIIGTVDLGQGPTAGLFS